MFKAKYASNISDQARHFELMEAFYKAEQRINSRCVMCPWSSQLSMEECSMGSTFWKLRRITKTHASKRLLEFRRETKSRNDRGATTPITCSTHRLMHEQGYTQSDMDEFDRMAK